jgi:exodeoxyribonuclease V alpha subunit
MNDTAFHRAFSALDLHFGRFIADFSSLADDRLALAAALLSRSARSGSVCLDLAAAAERPCPTVEGLSDAACPALEEWASSLRASPAVGAPGENRPLVLDEHHRLYLYRYWHYEDALARAIRERSAASIPGLHLDRLQDAMQRTFPPSAGGGDDGQRVAAAVAAMKRFCVITGGPGTGKTFTISKTLALLAQMAKGRPLRSLLAAPTGKAAARLRESLRHASTTTEAEATGVASLPDQVFTLHRLLRPIPGTPYFRHNRSNPLSADVVVVDEASMVDLALMAKLLDAVPPEARLILVGDKDQLASVEAGSVLGDICGRGRPRGASVQLVEAVERLTGVRLQSSPGQDPGPGDCIVELQKSYRFAPGSRLGELSQAVNRGDAAAALDILSQSSGASIGWLEPGAGADVGAELEKRILAGYRACFTAATPAGALEAFKRFKIFCAHKAGPHGVDSVNRSAERVLSRQGLIAPGGHRRFSGYPGRPVLITRNDYGLGLFNGDIGMTLADPASGKETLFVFFEGPDGGIRRFLPQRLPEHETAYAMTVHKSQGSEFDELLLVLPDRDSPVLTRELIYTALTRARHRITVWAHRAVLTLAINRRIERTSGLRDALWGKKLEA